MAAQKTTLSVALATFNEEEKLPRCLESVAGWVDEIVVVDGGSEDRTIAIAKQHHAKIVLTNNPSIFHINKQKALAACSGDWILQLDADEIVNSQLRQEILEIIVSSDAKNGYAVPRKNYFAGHWLSKGGQYPDYVVRLFRNGNGKFPAKSVHEQIQITGSTGRLTHPLIHNTYASVSEYWRKSDAYTSLTATEFKAQGVGKTIITWLRYMIFAPVATFLSLYIRHKGFVDGYWGFLFAWYSALHYPIAYKKYLSGTYDYRHK